jgi:hypothetical protein
MVQKIWKRTILFWTVLLAACTIQLVPNYDQTLVDGLDEANTTALIVFAEVEDGSPQSEFAQFGSRYAELIGKFDALQQRAANRQIPPLAARLSKLSIVRDFCNSKSNPTECVNASPSSLARALEVLRKMRDRHSGSGLARDTVLLFRNDYNTAMGQALTVENALKR